MTTRDGLRLASKHVRTKELHPEMLRRLQWVFVHPALPSGVCLSSAVRVLGRPPRGKERWGQPYGSVWYFWTRYLAGSGVLAADPNRKWVRDRGVPNGRASTHCVQDTGYSYAVDFRVRRQRDWAVVHDLCRQVALEFPLRKHPRYPEPWHCQMADENWSQPDRVLTRPLNAEITETLKFPILRRGHVSDSVRIAQMLLGNAGYVIEVDGCFGPQTLRAVKRFQRSHKLTVDGVIGPNTWRALGLYP